MSELEPIGDFSQIKKNAMEISLYGYKCKVISLDDLIEIKKTMTRPKDQETLRKLLIIKNQKK
jgi:predicted nucleotidyltransferase